MTLSYPLKNIALFLWKALVPLIFCWKLDRSCLCLEIWRDVTPYGNISAFSSTVLEVNKLTKHSRGRKEGNKSVIVFMPWLQTSHLLLNIHTKPRKNANIRAERIEKKIVCDTERQSGKRCDNIVASIFVLWTMSWEMLRHQIWQYRSITYVSIVYRRELIFFFQITICS